MTLFDCDICGGNVVPKTGPGRKYNYKRGVLVDVPDTFEIPTCEGCGEQYFTVERGEELDALVSAK